MDDNVECRGYFTRLAACVRGWNASLFILNRAEVGNGEHTMVPTAKSLDGGTQVAAFPVPLKERSLFLASWCCVGSVDLAGHLRPPYNDAQPTTPAPTRRTSGGGSKTKQGKPSQPPIDIDSGVTRDTRDMGVTCEPSRAPTSFFFFHCVDRLP